MENFVRIIVKSDSFQDKYYLEKTELVDEAFKALDQDLPLPEGKEWKLIYRGSYVTKGSTFEELCRIRSIFENDDTKVNTVCLHAVVHEY